MYESFAANLWKVKQNIELYLKCQIPGFQVIPKSDSKLMKFLSYILFFVPGFMTRFNTSFYPRVYPVETVTSSSDVYELSNYVQMIAHEGRHLLDRKKYSFWFNLAYLFPQVLSVFALLAFWKIWFILFLVFLAPIPSTRAWVEYRGYCVSIATCWWAEKRERDINYIVSNFISSNYYFMFPFKGYLTRKFIDVLEKVKNDEPLPEYITVFKEFFEE